MSRTTTFTALALTLWSAATFAGTQTDRIEANDSKTYPWTASRTGDVIISIDGDGDTDLDLNVYDSEGNVLGQDVSGDDNEQVRIHVTEGQDYEFYVENYGGVWNQFDLETAFTTEHFQAPVPANDRIVYEYQAPRDIEQIVATIHGTGASDIDVNIFDSHGERVAQGLSPDDHERIVFSPTPGEQYRVEISNLGDEENTIDLDFAEAD